MKKELEIFGEEKYDREETMDRKQVLTENIIKG